MNDLKEENFVGEQAIMESAGAERCQGCARRREMDEQVSGRQLK